MIHVQIKTLKMDALITAQGAPSQGAQALGQKHALEVIFSGHANNVLMDRRKHVLEEASS